MRGKTSSSAGTTGSAPAPPMREVAAKTALTMTSASLYRPGVAQTRGAAVDSSQGNSRSAGAAAGPIAPRARGAAERQRPPVRSNAISFGTAGADAGPMASSAPAAKVLLGSSRSSAPMMSGTSGAPSGPIRSMVHNVSCSSFPDVERTSARRPGSDPAINGARAAHRSPYSVCAIS